MLAEDMKATRKSESENNRKQVKEQLRAQSGTPQRHMVEGRGGGGGNPKP